MNKIYWEFFFNKLQDIMLKSWFNNIDWTLLISVLSFFLAMTIGIVTIFFTLKTIRIADGSLSAAKKSIEISIELYEKQKKDFENSEENARQANFLGMEIINGLFIQETMIFIDRFLSVLNMNLIKENIVSFDVQQRSTQFFFVFKDSMGCEIDAFNIWLINPSLFYGYVFEASRIDGKCLSDLKKTYEIYSESERLFHVFMFLTEDEMFKKYSELDAESFRTGLNAMMSDLTILKGSLNVNTLDSYKK